MMMMDEVKPKRTEKKIAIRGFLTKDHDPYVDIPKKGEKRNLDVSFQSSGQNRAYPMPLCPKSGTFFFQ